MLRLVGAIISVVFDFIFMVDCLTDKIHFQEWKYAKMTRYDYLFELRLKKIIPHEQMIREEYVNCINVHILNFRSQAYDGQIILCCLQKARNIVDCKI